MELGRYRLIRTLAKGGMAQLYLAIQKGAQGFEKVVVLKCVLAELCKSNEFVQMFLDEARLAAHLDHSNVVRVYDFGEIKGQYFLAMEYLPGEDLASIIQTVRKAGRPLPVEVVADVIMGAAMGLHFAHDLVDGKGKPLGIVHRDVSPSNIIVTYHGVVKLVDFGIARAESNQVKTAAGTVKGKYAYLSPEQAVGDPIDRRSDVFALGSVTHELLTGVRVFKRDSDLATLKAVAETNVLPPSQTREDVPGRLDAIVMKAMDPSLNRRYQTTAAMADDLAEFLAERGYVRSEQRLATFVGELFGEERKLAKLRVAHATVGGGEASVQRTPSLLRDLPRDLSPIRSDSGLASVSESGRIQVQTRSESRSITVTPVPRFTRGQWVGMAVLGVGVIAAAAALVRRSSPARTDNTSVVQLKRVPPPAEAPTVVPDKSGPSASQQTSPPSAPAQDPAASPTAAGPTSGAADTSTKNASASATHRVAKGKLNLDTSPWAEVFLNGRSLGETPLINVSLPAGRHILKLVNEPKGIHGAIEVEIEAGKTTTKKLNL